MTLPQILSMKAQFVLFGDTFTSCMIYMATLLDYYYKNPMFLKFFSNFNHILSPHDTYLKSTKCFNIDYLNHFKRLFMFQTYDTINKKAISIFWKEEININNESIVPLWQAIQTLKYSLNPPWWFVIRRFFDPPKHVVIKWYLALL